MARRRPGARGLNLIQPLAAVVTTALPPRSRDLAAEIRPELDAINEEMLSLLADMDDLPSLREGRCAGLFDSVLSASPALAQLSGLRRAAERVALRSLRAAGAAHRYDESERGIA